MGKAKNILIALVALALVFTMAFVGALLWFQSNSDSEAKGKKEEEKQKTTVHAIEEPIVSNLLDSTRINVRVGIELVTLEDKEFDKELEENMGLATTVIITVLRGKSVAEVTNPKAPISMREEIVKELNKEYHTDKFVNVNFKEFIVQ